MAENVSQLPPNPLPTAPKIVDDADAGWIWKGLESFDSPDVFHGNAHAGGPGSYAAYTFHGTGVTVIGMASESIVVDERTHKMGRAKISIDGKPITTSSVLSSRPVYDFNLCTIAGLSNENHVLQVEADGGWIVVDYINVATVSSNDPAVPNGRSGEVSLIVNPTVQKTPSPFSNERVWVDGTNTYFQFSFTRPYVNFRILLDIDDNALTGYQDSGIGSEYLIENGTMYRSTANTHDWDWQPLQGTNVTLTKTGNSATFLTSGVLPHARIVVQGLDKDWHGDTDPNLIVFTQVQPKR